MTKVIDVREESELLRGVIPGARSLAMSTFLDAVGTLGERDVVLVCSSGSRSRAVAEYLVGNGFPAEVANFSGGMVEWREEGREVAAWRPAAPEPRTE